MEPLNSTLVIFKCDLKIMAAVLALPLNSTLVIFKLRLRKKAPGGIPPLNSTLVIFKCDPHFDRLSQGFHCLILSTSQRSLYFF